HDACRERRAEEPTRSTFTRSGVPRRTRPTRPRLPRLAIAISRPHGGAPRPAQQSKVRSRCGTSRLERPGDVFRRRTRREAHGRMQLGPVPQHSGTAQRLR
ncbi:unnamed protein product, partial [Ectocarpus fasciculatus]